MFRNHPEWYVTEKVCFEFKTVTERVLWTSWKGQITAKGAKRYVLLVPCKYILSHGWWKSNFTRLNCAIATAWTPFLTPCLLWSNTQCYKKRTHNSDFTTYLLPWTDTHRAGISTGRAICIWFWRRCTTTPGNANWRGLFARTITFWRVPPKDPNELLGVLHCMISM